MIITETTEDHEGSKHYLSLPEPKTEGNSVVLLVIASNKQSNSSGEASIHVCFTVKPGRQLATWWSPPAHGTPRRRELLGLTTDPGRMRPGSGCQWGVEPFTHRPWAPVTESVLHKEAVKLGSKWSSVAPGLTQPGKRDVLLGLAGVLPSFRRRLSSLQGEGGVENSGVLIMAPWSPLQK